MKNVRELLRLGYYQDKSDQEFKFDAIEWVGKFDDIEKFYDDIANKYHDRNTILDLLCDFGMNSLF